MGGILHQATHHPTPPGTMPQEMTLKELAAVAEAAAVAKPSDPSLLLLYNRGWDAGYSEGYAKAQRDIRMALGCKE